MIDELISVDNDHLFAEGGSAGACVVIRPLTPINGLIFAYFAIPAASREMRLAVLGIYTWPHTPSVVDVGILAVMPPDLARHAQFDVARGHKSADRAGRHMCRVVIDVKEHATDCGLLIFRMASKVIDMPAAQFYNAGLSS